MSSWEVCHCLCYTKLEGIESHNKYLFISLHNYASKLTVKLKTTVEIYLRRKINSIEKTADCHKLKNNCIAIMRLYILYYGDCRLGSLLKLIQGLNENHKLFARVNQCG